MPARCVSRKTMRHPCLNYDSPLVFTPKQRLKLLLGGPLIAWPMKLMEWTTRSEVRYPERWEEASADGKPVMIAIWHETIAVAVWEKRYT